MPFTTGLLDLKPSLVFPSSVCVFDNVHCHSGVLPQELFPTQNKTKNNVMIFRIWIWIGWNKPIKDVLCLSRDTLVALSEWGKKNMKKFLLFYLHLQPKVHDHVLPVSQQCAYSGVHVRLGCKDLLYSWAVHACMYHRIAKMLFRPLNNWFQIDNN